MMLLARTIRYTTGLAQNAREAAGVRQQTAAALTAWKLACERRAWSGLKQYWQRRVHKKQRAQAALQWRRYYHLVTMYYHLT
jgi:hypothetical protein